MKKIPRLRARGALGLLLAFVLMVAFPSHRGGAQGPATETLSFVAIADTYVDSSSPTSNYNSDSRLRIDGSPTRIAYLRFLVAGV